MADVLTPEQRRLNMSRIKGKNTKPELLIRKALHSKGLRYRIHFKDLPAKPDLVFSKYKVALFIHGCFWHGHNCPLFKIPQSRQEFWLGKINKNRKRDFEAIKNLQESGWRVFIVWECSLKGRLKLSFSEFCDALEKAILDTKNQLNLLEFKGMPEIEK